MKAMGPTAQVASSGGRLSVPVTFFLDEQAVLHFSLFGPHGEPLLILQNGTVFRRMRTQGLPTHNLRVLVLRPGTITASVGLLPNQILPGRRYKLRLTAVDYDGHTTVRTIPFKG